MNRAMQAHTSTPANEKMHRDTTDVQDAPLKLEVLKCLNSQPVIRSTAVARPGR